MEQTNIFGHSRRYAYRHHLLLQYRDCNGFSHRFSWISLAQLRERWAGSQLDAKELASLYPITLYNSYQARATNSVAEDGTDRCLIDHIDEDTSRVTEPDGGVLEFTFDENWLATEVRRIPADGGPAQSLGHRGAKWVSKDKPQTTLRRRGHEKMAEFEVEEGTIAWLESLSKDFDEVEGEACLPCGVITKYNEPGAMGIGNDLLDEFNKRVRKVTIR